ncbi:MAG: lipid A phosphoethanolamine transferase [Duncaniella sp.]|nr:lipid A phosphoethanolamine transferase [Duncaniella sp.]
MALAITEQLSPAGRLTNVILPAGIYMLLLAWSRRIGRSVWMMFPILFIAAFQIVLLRLYGKSVIAVDMFLNVATTNPGEAGELLGSLTGIVLVDIVVFLPLLVWAGIAWAGKVTLRPLFRRRALRVGSGVTLAGALCLAGAFCSAVPYRIADQLYPVNAFYNLALSVRRTAEVASYHETSSAFSPQASSLRPADEDDLIIIVIGETSRAENWQLCGYERPTNPRLSDRGGLTVFDRVLSQSNTTHKAVPMLMTDLTAETFGDSINRRKGVITAFREAGYETTYISNQGRNHSYIDFLGCEADEVLFLRDSLTATEMLRPITDLSILPHMAGRLAQARAPKELIVIHTYGSHFSYIDRYDEGQRLFTPDTYSRSSAEVRDNLVNAYDNTIVATDLLLDSIMSMAEADGRSAALIYTSDHGEDIYDDSRRRFLHASPTPTFHQVNVPLIVWTSPEFARRHPEIVTALESNRHKRVASSESFYHTALQLGGVDARTFVPSSSLASEGFAEHPRIYLTDHNNSVPLRESGFEGPDFELLDAFDR